MDAVLVLVVDSKLHRHILHKQHDLNFNRLALQSSIVKIPRIQAPPMKFLFRKKSPMKRQRCRLPHQNVYREININLFLCFMVIQFIYYSLILHAFTWPHRTVTVLLTTAAINLICKGLNRQQGSEIICVQNVMKCVWLCWSTSHCYWRRSA